MRDYKPPRSSGDEREVLRALLQYQRESFVRKVEGVDERAARAAIVASGTTLLWLTKHMARAEQLWIVQRFAGQRPELFDDVVQSIAASNSISGAWSRRSARTNETGEHLSDLHVCGSAGDCWIPRSEGAQFVLVFGFDDPEAPRSRVIEHGAEDHHPA
jgi:hypothetical protein